MPMEMTKTSNGEGRELVKKVVDNRVTALWNYNYATDG